MSLCVLQGLSCKNRETVYSYKSLKEKIGKMPTEPALRACLKRRQITINRVSIALLGNPTHLNFHYNDGDTRLLYISATSENDLDAFEIPRYFWHSSRPCVVSRSAFFRALEYRLHWQDGIQYSYPGTLTELKGVPAVVFTLDNDTGFTRYRPSVPFDRCVLDFGFTHPAMRPG